jgi:hypothetical protein
LGPPMRFLGHVCTCRILGKVYKIRILCVWSRTELPSDLTWARDPDVGGRLAPPTPRAALATYPGAQGPYSSFCRPYCGRNIGKTEEYPQDKSGGRWIVRKQSWPPQVHPRDFSGKKVPAQRPCADFAHLSERSKSSKPALLLRQSCPPKRRGDE